MRRGTSLRTRPPEDTAEVARALMPILGIARVSDVTHLDRLSLPVFISVRPAGKTLRVHAGKGLSAADACAGALMEAVEYAVSERHSSAGADTSLPLGDLAAAFPARLNLSDFAPRLGVAGDPLASMPAVLCEEITSGIKTLLPAELVLMPFAYDGAEPIFGWSTNGLASGNSLEEATLHALFEVLERDTMAMHLARDESRPVPNASLPAPFRKLATEWERLGVQLAVRFMPNVFGLPCFEAGLHQPGSRRVRVTRGWGLHFDRHVALSRAICEAAQTRLVIIQGKRRNPMTAERVERLLARLVDPRRPLAFENAPNFAHRSVSAASKDLLSRLAVKGFAWVFRRQMVIGGDPAALRGLHVVKVIVPRCEFAASSHIRMGPRLMARAFGKQARLGSIVAR